MTLQGDSLWMVALGLDAPDRIGAGVHLRWGVAARLGFAPFGFDLFRRVHMPAPYLCMDLAVPTGGAPTRISSADLTVDSTLPLVWYPRWGSSGRPARVVDTAAQLRISCQQPMREFRLTTDQLLGTVRATAFDGETPVDVAAIPPPGGTATLRADRFTQVVVTTENETGFVGLCRAAVAAGASAGWGAPLASLALPFDWPTAAARIPAPLRPAYEPGFGQVLTAISLLGEGPREVTATGGDPAAPRFRVDPTRLLLAAALDPALARILGLYLLDDTAAVGTSYDYRVVGSWGAALSHEWICFDVRRGTPRPVPPPVDVLAVAEPVDGTLFGAAADEPATVALTWSPPGAVAPARDPVGPVRYHVSRQQLQAGGWSDAVLLTASGPVLVDAAAAAAPSYLDGPVAAGDYRYLVAGVDLFGRVGHPAEPARVTVTDEIPPPPPTGVTASVDRVAGRIDGSVSWAWPAQLRARATDATAFQVYLQTDRLDPAGWRPAGPPVPVTAAAAYQLTVPDLALATGPLTPVARAWFGVATIDRAGNSGPVSGAAPVAVAHSDPPPAPPAPTGPAFATRADYHGRSRCPLTIAGTEPGLYYDVLRALDATLLALAGADPAAGGVDDAALLALADRYDDAFTRLSTRDAAGRPLTGTGGALTYTDTLPGTGRNRFVYKVQSTDRAGNRSPLSGGVVVHLVDVVPPRRPVLTGVFGGDRRITLRWAANRDPDLALYRLFRTADPVAAADVRTMPLVAAFLLDPAAATDADRAVDTTAQLSADGAGCSYPDPGLPGGVDQYYRLVAVDTAGNASAASPAVRGRPFDAARPVPAAARPSRPTE